MRTQKRNALLLFIMPLLLIVDLCLTLPEFKR